jgi:hypothetical protein
MKRHYGCLWIHFAYAIEALAPISHRYVVILKGTPLAYQLYRPTKARWGGKGTFIQTGFKLVDIFQIMPGLGYSREVKKMGDFVIKGGYPRNIPWAKAQGLVIDGRLLRGFYTRYKQYPTFWIIDLPLLLIPGKIYRLLSRLRQRS